MKQFDKIVIMVAAHKEYWMPDDEMYIPVFVGSTGKKTPVASWQRDDDGENISTKNSTFCELTGHYWMWKNVDAEVYGLSHYRRYFSSGRFWCDKKSRVLRKKQLKKILEHNDVIVPHKRHYVLETNYSQYMHAHHETDLIATRQVIAERCPQYLAAWDKSMKKRSGHRFNMFVMKKSFFHEYSAWLFDLLFELEKRIDISTYSSYDQRVFGFLGERLLDVWFEYNRLSVAECSIIHMEKQMWIRKIGTFLRRKIIGEIKVHKK